jgi:hypothetical protein
MMVSTPEPPVQSGCPPEALLLALRIATRREQAPFVVSSSVVVVTVMLAAWADIAGRAANTMAITARAVKNFCGTEEKIVVRMLGPFKGCMVMFDGKNITSAACSYRRQKIAVANYRLQDTIYCEKLHLTFLQSAWG